MAIDDTLARDITRLMQDAGFRRFVWRLLEQAGFTTAVFAAMPCKWRAAKAGANRG